MMLRYQIFELHHNMIVRCRDIAQNILSCVAVENADVLVYIDLHNFG